MSMIETSKHTQPQEWNDITFDEGIGAGVSLVDFWAPWCGPCQMQAPILDQVAAQIGSRATVAKVNVDEAPTVARQFKIQGIPTLILFKDGEPVRRFHGIQMENVLTSALEKALA